MLDSHSFYMPSSSPEFIPIDQAAEDYPPSRRTIEREREKARDKGDMDTLNAFMLKTNDDHEFLSPAQDLYQKLSKDGRDPKTFVRVEWLDKTFRHDKRHGDAPHRQEGSDSDAEKSQPDALHLDPMTQAILDQLTEKDKQLAAKDDQIKQLTFTLKSASEAYKQAALTMQKLQERLPALPESFSGSAVLVPKPPDDPPSEKKSESDDTTLKPKPGTPKPRKTNTSPKNKKNTTKPKPSKPKTPAKKTNFFSKILGRK